MPANYSAILYLGYFYTSNVLEEGLKISVNKDFQQNQFSARGKIVKI